MQSKRELSVSRLLMQVGFLLVTFLIGFRHLLPGDTSRGDDFDAFCPFGGIEMLWAYLGTGQTLKTTILLNFAIMTSVIGLSLATGKTYCGWVYP